MTPASRARTRDENRIMIHRQIAVLLALVFAVPLAVRAQTLDYAAFEALFGEPVTASVTGAPQRASQVAATMTIITAEDIRRSGARDLPSVLERVAGVDAQQSTRDHTDVSIRGYNEPFAPRLLVLVDGRQVYADYFGFTPWSTVPVELDAIRQIEIVKGPNSALFGFNAVGGVVNIITHDPLAESIQRLTLTGGTQDHREASLVTTWKPLYSLGLRLSAGHRDNDEFSTPIDPANAGVRRGNERNAVSLALAWRAADRLRVGLEATYSDAEHSVLAPLYRLAYDRYEVSSIKASLAADTDHGLLQATAYTNWIEAEAFAGDSRTTALSPDNRVTVLQIQGISKLASRHTLRLSAEYRDNAMATVPVGGGDISHQIAAAGAMWEWRIQPALTLTSALRVDHWRLRREGTLPAGYTLTNDDWRRSESEWSYNAGLVWQVDDTDTVRLVVARGVQVPNLLALGGLVMRLSPPWAPPAYASGDPALRPTTVDNFEIAWDHAFTGLDARLHTSLYRGHSQHLLANAGDARPMEGLVSLPINVGDSKTVGIEVAFDVRFGHSWRGGASYTGQAVDDRFRASADPAVTLAAFEETTPKHVFRVNAGWADGPWETDLYLRYQSRFDGFTRQPGPGTPAELKPIGGYFSLDARVARRFGERLTLAVGGQNLHRAEQRETSAPAVERMVFATLEVGLGRRP